MHPSLTIIKTNFYRVVGSDAPVYKTPATNSIIDAVLLPKHRVLIIERSKNEVIIGGKKGFWVHVDTGIIDERGRETAKGWMADCYLEEERKK
jgi:hypothetical protein